MKNFLKKLIAPIRGKKTHIVAMLMASTVVVKYIGGDINFQQMLLSGDMQTMLEAFGLSTIRAAVEKSGLMNQVKESGKV